MAGLRHKLRMGVRRLGYDIAPWPRGAANQADLTPVDVCSRKQVPILSCLEMEDYAKLCPPLMDPPLPVSPNYAFKFYKNAREAAENTSMQNYVRLVESDKDLLLTDIYPESHYYSRQRMLTTVYKLCLGGRLDGFSVVDVGCSSGYYCFYASRLGAKKVVGFDARPEHEDQFGLLHSTLNASASCEYRNLDMEFEFETLEKSYDVVLAMGTLYHVYDHPRFVRNLYRCTDRILVLEGECSGSPDNQCLAVMEDKSNLRSSIHGPVIFPSLGWMIELLRWVGFRNVRYVSLPSDVADRWGFNQLRRAMLIAEK